MNESNGTPVDATVRALHVDADEDVIAAVAAYAEREHDDLTVAGYTSAVRAREAIRDGDYDCLIVGRETADGVLEAVDGDDLPVVLYTDRPAAVDPAVLANVETLVEKGNGPRGRHLLVEKLLGAVGDESGSGTDTPADRDGVTGRASYFLVYADGTVVWSSDSFESVFPVEAVEGTVPETPSLGERLTALLADDPNAIRRIRGDDGPAWFTVPTADGDAHFRYARHELPSSIGPLDLVAIEDVTDAVRRAGRLGTLEPVVERAQAGLYVLDENGVIEYCNDAFAEMLGYEPGELIGEHATATLVEGELERGQEAVDRLLTDPETDGATVELTFVDAGGEPLPVSVRFGLLTDGSGTYDGLVGVARDVTGERRYDRTLEQYRTVVESAGNPVYALDADDRITLVNEAMAALFDRPRADLVGTPLSDLLPDAAVERLCETVAAIREEGRRRGACEIRLTDADGRERLFEVAVGVLRPEGDEGSVGTLHDVTQRERRESDLDLLKQILARVLRHDVRTGLTVVRGQAEVLAERLDGDEREMAETIIDRSEDLVDTVEKVRTIGDVLESDAGRVTLDLATTVDRAITNVGAAHPDAEYRADVPERRLVRAHPTLPYAVENLVENAVAHNGDDRPTVRVTVEDGDERVRLRIADDGPGISEAEIDVLEQREETPLRHGTGAGLWLVSWVVDRSDGGIDFETGRDGTTVTVTLDAADAAD